MTRSRNASRTMHIDADVAVLGDERFSGVETHAHADRTIGERVTAFGRGRQRLPRLRERDEERVALRVHLEAAVPREGVTQHPPVLRQHLRVGVPELVQQPRRALDVGEKESDGSGRPLGHAGMICTTARTVSSGGGGAASAPSGRSRSR